MRSATLHVRMTEEEYAAAVARAAAAGVTLSAYVRALTLNDTNRPVIKTNPEAIQQVYTLLKRSGGLLNQVCRVLNRGGYDSLLNQELNRALNSISQAADATSQFIAEARNSF